MPSVDVAILRRLLTLMKLLYFTILIPYYVTIADQKSSSESLLLAASSYSRDIDSVLFIYSMSHL